MPGTIFAEEPFSRLHRPQTDGYDIQIGLLLLLLLQKNKKMYYLRMHISELPFLIVVVF